MSEYLGTPSRGRVHRPNGGAWGPLLYNRRARRPGRRGRRPGVRLGPLKARASAARWRKAVPAPRLAEEGAPLVVAQGLRWGRGDVLAGGGPACRPP